MPLMSKLIVPLILFFPPLNSLALYFRVLRIHSYFLLLGLLAPPLGNHESPILNPPPQKIRQCPLMGAEISNGRAHVLSHVQPNPQTPNSKPRNT
jgi:hypothetical protein